MGSGLVFVTVGTTRFQDLTNSVVQAEVLQTLAALGYDELRVQYGHGQRPDVEHLSVDSGLRMTAYDFKPSLADDMAQAELIIGHAGAGTILEALEAGKRMLVVVNDLLMNNHQTELASQMEAQGYLCACTCATLKTDLLRLHNMPSKHYTPGEPVRAAAFISATLDEARKARFEASYDRPLLPFAVATVFALLMAILAAGLA